MCLTYDFRDVCRIPHVQTAPRQFSFWVRQEPSRAAAGADGAPLALALQVVAAEAARTALRYWGAVEAAPLLALRQQEQGAAGRG